MVNTVSSEKSITFEYVSRRTALGILTILDTNMEGEGDS